MGCASSVPAPHGSVKGGHGTAVPYSCLYRAQWSPLIVRKLPDAGPQLGPAYQLLRLIPPRTPLVGQGGKAQ